MLKALPIDPIEQNEPIDPMLKELPIEPIEKALPIEPIDRKEPIDPMECSSARSSSPRADRPSSSAGIGMGSLSPVCAQRAGQHDAARLGHPSDEQ